MTAPTRKDDVMASDGKYGTITASKKQFHENEPLFILRAADPLAVDRHIRNVPAKGHDS